MICSRNENVGLVLLWRVHLFLSLLPLWHVVPRPDALTKSNLATLEAAASVSPRL